MTRGCDGMGFLRTVAEHKVWEMGSGKIDETVNLKEVEWSQRYLEQGTSLLCKANLRSALL